eukprot:m.52123 g.52123  ORF g.52123 m.52123 type:complete len:98 (-) comp10985_c1_seq2:367-660(-)
MLLWECFDSCDDDYRDCNVQQQLVDAVVDAVDDGVVVDFVDVNVADAVVVADIDFVDGVDGADFVDDVDFDGVDFVDDGDRLLAPHHTLHVVEDTGS